MSLLVLFLAAGVVLAGAAAGAVPAAVAPHAPWVKLALAAAAAWAIFRAARALVRGLVHGAPKEPVRRMPWHAPVDELIGLALVALALGAAGDALGLAGPGPFLLGCPGALLALTGVLSTVLPLITRSVTPEQIAAAQAAAAGKAPDRSRGLRFGCSFALLVLILLPPFLTPAFGRCAAWAGGYDDLVLDALRSCGEARGLLGEELGPSTYGWSCGSMETGGGAGNAGWAMPVSGSRGRGRYEFTAEQHGGRWSLTGAELTVGSRTVDVLACARAPETAPAAPPPASTSTAAPSAPPAAAAPAGGAAPAPTADLATLEQACQAGHAPSCVAAGAALEQGTGTAQDLRRARERYDRACGLGFQAGCLLRDKLPGAP